jgi:death-on-curing protein
LTRYITLAEYFWLAEQVTGVDAATLFKVSKVELADSALQAPQSSYEGQEFYPELAQKAAVLTCRLAWNHPLLDGNKRAAWACLESHRVLWRLQISERGWGRCQPTKSTQRN